jgi:hypothetical protein
MRRRRTSGCSRLSRTPCGTESRTAPPADGIGLSNTRARLLQLYGDRASLTIAPGNRGGAAVARNGREGVATILERRPDLVFLDVQMPEMDGFAVAQEVEVSAIDYLLKPVTGEVPADSPAGNR